MCESKFRGGLLEQEQGHSERWSFGLALNPLFSLPVPGFRFGGFSRTAPPRPYTKALVL